LTAKPGEALNELVHLLERTLVPGAATIEKNKRIPTIGTGQLREFDVLITWKQAHHTILTAIECRDRSRPVGVPAVEAFAKKCERCGVDHRVFVSATGFTASARKEAEALSVDLMDVAKARAVDWHSMQFLIGFVRQFEPFKAMIQLEGKGEIAEPFVLLDINRTEVTLDVLQATLMNVYQQANPSGNSGEVGKLNPIQFRANTVDWIARGADGREFAVKYIDAEGGFTVKKTLQPVTTYRYGPAGSETEVAFADAEVGELHGKLALVRRDDGRLSVHWVPTNAPASR
jgi:hypothetical protein